MKNALIVLLIGISFIFSGCEYYELKDLPTTLGEYRYIGIDPKISFTINSYEFLLPEDKYNVGKISVNYSINLKQNNKDFPLNKYKVGVVLDVVDAEGTRHGEIYFGATIIDEVAAYSKQNDYIYEFKNYTKFKSLKLIPRYYEWSPIVQFAPYK